MNQDVSLLERIEQVAGSDTFNLPVFSDIALQVQKILGNEDYDVRDIERLICSDQSLASEVLRVANSSFYAGLARVTTVREAAVRLGGDQLASVVLLASERQKFTAKDEEINRWMAKLWMHAMGCALAAQWLAKRLKYPELANEAFLAGLIHDIGKLAVLKVVDHLRNAEGLDFPTELVLEVMESAHVAQGYALAQKWRLPERYCVILRDHHLEDFDPDNILLVLVRLADLACLKMGLGMRQDASVVLSATPEAQSLLANEVLLAELEIMLEDTLHLGG